MNDSRVAIAELHWRASWHAAYCDSSDSKQDFQLPPAELTDSEPLPMMAAKAMRAMREAFMSVIRSVWLHYAAQSKRTTGRWDIEKADPCVLRQVRQWQ